MNLFKKLFITSVFFFIFKNASSNNEERTILIFAPASLNTAMEKIISVYKLENNLNFKTVYLGTSQLVKQIINGANPDIFISASREWMEFLIQKNLVISNLRFDLAYNKLVLITNSRNDKIRKMLSISEAKEVIINSSTKLSLALVESVPAGIYAKQFLINIGIWNNVRKNIAQSHNVKIATTYVLRGDLKYGIVYKTDAHDIKNLKIIHQIDDKYHNKIVYPVVPLNKRKTTTEFLNFLKSKNTKNILEKKAFEIK